MKTPFQYLAKKTNKLLKAPRWHAAQKQFDRVTLRPHDIAIDCGASVGDVTAMLVAGGARVTAFEPNPDAYAMLSARFLDNDRVTCVPAAVTDVVGAERLYLNRRYDRDPLGHSSGSSLLSSKHNLDASRYVEVRTIDLAAFIHALGQRVRVLKLDIEGAEFRVLNHLIDTGAIARIDHVFCETHEFKAPGLAAERRILRRRLRHEEICHVNLDWH